VWDPGSVIAGTIAPAREERAVGLCFGVDIGGTGIKAGLVDTDTGTLTGERVRVPTPRGGEPEAVCALVRDLVTEAGWTGPVGVAFPAVVQHGVALTAANIDRRWIGTDVAAAITAVTGTPTTVLNDADAAGVAEIRHGAGAGVPGVVLLLTLGTGIGSALFTDGTLVPNTEFGHLEIDGHDAETRASEGARERHGLDWRTWAARLEHYLRRVDALVWPDLIVLGGGATKKSDKWLSHLEVRPRLAVAALRNDAGIVGAAMAAAEVSIESRHDSSG
jgi:polyphosphate glucokinase